ncbi:MAG: hypothetical protein IJF27_03690 [Oscillospiraceae bacterium]|nr:hypothetical protein [Oscillospiraceae bacterium]
MTDKLLEMIADRYPLTEIDAGDMSALKANGMKFSVKAYKAAGLGHVSVMRAKGFFGLMKMDTLIINPTELDLPLYSYDRIFAMGNDTLIVELYDTLLGQFDSQKADAAKSEFAHLPERDPGEHWYDDIKLVSSISKKGRKKQTPELDALTLKHFEGYLNADAKAVADLAAKQKKAAFYVCGLLERGGPSTDVFKKELGEEKTAELFKDYLFGITE